MTTRGEINSNFYQIVNVDGNGAPTSIKSQYITNGNVDNANYANFAGTAYSVDQANVVGLGNIATVNLDGNVSNVLSGLGTWIAAGGGGGGNIAGSNTEVQFNDGGVFGASANLTFNKTTNILASNYFSGSGNLLSNIQGSNVTGDVSGANHANIADSANSVSVGNVTGIGNIATINLDGNSSNVLYGNGIWATISIPSGSKISNGTSNVDIATVNGDVTIGVGGTSNIAVFTTTGANISGNITVGNANLGNLATANFFSGSGNLLSNIQGSNVSGDVSGANHANIADTANSVSGSNVSGQVANALVAGTVYTASQGNITSLGTLTGLTSGGVIDFSTSSNVTLGSNANVHIGGGTNGYVLSTNGSGALTWIAQTSGGTPGGSNTQVQFNNGGSFGASANLTFNNTTNTLTTTNFVSANSTFTKYNETNVSGGSVSGTITPDVATGTIFNYTLTGNITLNSLANAVAGSGATIILTQDGTGNRLLTSTMKYLGGYKILSTTANAVDIITVFYDGSTYYASLGQGFA